MLRVFWVILLTVFFSVNLSAKQYSVANFSSKTLETEIENQILGQMEDVNNPDDHSCDPREDPIEESTFKSRLPPKKSILKPFTPMQTHSHSLLYCLFETLIFYPKPLH